MWKQMSCVEGSGDWVAGKWRLETPTLPPNFLEDVTFEGRWEPDIWNIYTMFPWGSPVQPRAVNKIVYISANPFVL